MSVLNRDWVVMRELWGSDGKKQGKLLLDFRGGNARTCGMPVADIMREKLAAAFAPRLLTIEDESARHAGHAGARPDGETHFSVRIVADSFRGLSRVERQRRIYAVLAGELRGGVHALSLAALAPEEAD